MIQNKDDLLLAETFKSLGIEKCTCGRILDRGDIAWNNGNTEARTPYSMLEVICQACDEEIFYTHSWWPHIESMEEFCDELKDNWKKKK